MNDTKHEAAMHGPQPMSDQSLEFMRGLLDGHERLSMAECRVLITEVDRLRAILDVRDGLLKMQGDELARLDGERTEAQAALARVTDERMAERITRHLHEYPPIAATWDQDVAEVRNMLVRAVAADEQGAGR